MSARLDVRIFGNLVRDLGVQRGQARPMDARLVVVRRVVAEVARGLVVEAIQHVVRRHEVIRDVAVRMYDALVRRPWSAEQQLASRDRGPNQLRIWDHLGRIVLRAGFDERRAFYALSAVLSYVLGYAVQEAAAARSDWGRAEYLSQMGEFLASLDPREFPAVVAMAEVFATHQQREQFESGLDVLLDGLEKQLAGIKSEPD